MKRIKKNVNRKSNTEISLADDQNLVDRETKNEEARDFHSIQGARAAKNHVRGTVKWTNKRKI